MKNFVRTIKNNYQFMLMVIPGALWFLIFSYIPMLGIVIAFKDLRISRFGFIQTVLESKWMGFKNFKYLFSTKDAFIITRNTVLYNLAFIFLGLVFALAFAIIITEMSHKFLGKLFQTAMFMPYFLSWIVISYFVYAFLSDNGLANQIITSLGGKAVNWYLNPKPWPFILIFTAIWKGTGYSSVVYIATIAGFDKSYYEAAMIDGADKFQQIKFITLPLLKPVITMMLLLSIGKIFNADFGLFYQVPMNSGVLYPVTNVIDTYVYRGLTTMGDFGMTAAAGLYQSTVGLVLILVSNYLVRKYDNENSLF
ncbi:putative multiple-sugar transport system permease YteP [Clostridium oryzae]|uniref:Putative multiple-sugar transport system permease YteP n=1 Tax=Clostridium oryzae TaxID=1450648 RepID=A0A1V4IXU7_9CLOT|nr:putative multiple-sugar transport system permease YteP [Clostridium oryzae]